MAQGLKVLAVQSQEMRIQHLYNKQVVAQNPGTPAAQNPTHTHTESRLCNASYTCIDKINPFKAELKKQFLRNL